MLLRRMKQSKFYETLLNNLKMAHIQEQEGESMKETIWQILADSNTYKSFTTNLSPKEALVLDDKILASSFLTTAWEPMSLELWTGEKKRTEKKKKTADFMDSGLICDAISIRAKSFLHPLIDSQTEYLELKTPIGEYSGLYVKELDCLNKASSKVKTFTNSERILRVIKYAFLWEKLADIHIFRLPGFRWRKIFVSDKFREVVEKNNLTGLLFYPVPIVEDK